MLRRLAVAALTWLCLAGPSQAQGFGFGFGRGGGAPAGNFDFYVLALSWSPGFCELDGDRSRNREQCAAGNGLGFVVHGLWPQYERGYPSDCSSANRSPSRLAMAEAEGVYPSQGLARYEWRKHGTCTGSSPADYFRDVRRARDRVAIPPALAGTDGERSWTVLDLERAFVAANPGLRTDMMSVSCRRGMLQEVRICFSKDLRGFRSCPEVDRSGCRARSLTVLAPR